MPIFTLNEMNTPEAIKLLEIAYNKAFGRKEKARLQYILAQLYRETGNINQAADAFMAVTKLNPPYKMAFNARINAAGLYSGLGQSDKLKKDLNKMLRDEKNLEFRDQIYFALGNIYFKEGNTTQAIDNFAKSVAPASTTIIKRHNQLLPLPTFISATASTGSLRPITTQP
jgi:tetratricopeptide (TPR) repeat protein